MNMRSPFIWQVLAIIRARVDVDDVLGGAALMVLLIALLWIGLGLGLSHDTELLSEIAR